MSTRKREPGKNYIGLMIDDEEQRATEPAVPSDRASTRLTVIRTPRRSPVIGKDRK